MKTFKDLNVGDSIFVGFEKKNIVYIKSSSYKEDDIKIHTGDGGVYIVPYYVISYSIFSLYVHEEQVLIASDKEAIVKYYIDELVDLQTHFDIKKDYLKQMIEKAKELK